MESLKFIGRIVTDGEKFTINGVNPWNFDWEQTNIPQIKVSHPQYPEQNYLFNIFKINNNGSDIFFAAGEYSNMAWGFYVSGRSEVKF